MRENLKIAFRAFQLITTVLAAPPFIFWGINTYQKWLYNKLIWFEFGELAAAILSTFTLIVFIIASGIGLFALFISTPFWWRIKQYVLRGRFFGKVLTNVGREKVWADEAGSFKKEEEEPIIDEPKFTPFDFPYSDHPQVQARKEAQRQTRKAILTREKK